MIANTVLFLGLLFLSAITGYFLVRLTSWWMEDFVSYFSSPEPPAAPLNWSLLEKGQIPQSTPDAIEHSKEHLSKSCEVHGQCVPRTSHYGLIGRPLQMDE